MQESLGNYLRKERETKNISLEQVAYATRINLKMLMALEEDDHDALPAQTFVRGYLQAYAKYVKLDGQDVLLRYQHLLATTPVKQRSALKSHYVYVRERYQEKKQLFLIISLFSLCLISAGAYFALKTKHDHSKQATQQVHILQNATDAAPTTTPTPEAVASVEPTKEALKDKEKEKEKEKEKAKVAVATAAAPTPTPAPTTPPVVATPAVAPAPPTPAANPAGSDKKNFTLALKAKTDVWIRFQPDEEPVKDITLKEGKTLILKSNKVFKLFSGNLGAFETTLNGKDITLLSSNSKAKSVVIPESEAVNYPPPLFPQFVKKEGENSSTPAKTP